LIAVVWVAVVIALAVPALKAGVFDVMSTDDAMRMVEVRDLIGGQNWFDLSQHRLDPPGASMHWSRVIDAPLAAMILMLRPLLGKHIAEIITSAAWPALLFGAALLLVAALARRMSDERNASAAQIASVLLAALSIPALIHFRTGAIDHHNAQIVLLLGLVLSLSTIERSAVSAWLAGLTATLSLAIGLEMLPAIAALCLVVFLLSLWRGGAFTARAGLFGAALSVFSLLLAALLVPHSSFDAAVCDAFGGPVLLLIAGGGGCLMSVAIIERFYLSRGTRFAIGAVTGLIVLGVFFRLFPGCMASPYAHVPPLVTSFWLNRVMETLSVVGVTRLMPQKLAGYYGFPLLALGFAVVALMRASASERLRWILAVVTLIALIAISLWELRGAAAANIVAAPFFAACIARLWPLREQRAKLLLAALIASPAALTGIGLAVQPLPGLIVRQAAPRQDMVLSSAACQTLSGAAPLAALPPGRIMAAIDQGPAILAATGHSVFAAPYHRNNDGNLAMIDAMMAAPQSARQILHDRQADYVVICAGSSDQADFVRLAPNGLAARLGRGETFDFLEPLDVDPTHQLSVWRLRP
jgi:hypothetical protein